MAGNNDDLIGCSLPFDVADHIGALDLGQSLRRQSNFIFTPDLAERDRSANLRPPS